MCVRPLVCDHVAPVNTFARSRGLPVLLVRAFGLWQNVHLCAIYEKMGSSSHRLVKPLAKVGYKSFSNKHFLYFFLRRETANHNAHPSAEQLGCIRNSKTN